ALALSPVITYIAAAPGWQPAPTPIIGEQTGGVFTGGVTTTSWPSSTALAHSAQPYLLALWLAGVCVLGLRLAGGLVGVWRVSQRRLPLPRTLAERVERLGKRLRIDALPRVFLSRHISEALAVGFWRPVVLVPAAWVTEMPLEVLEAVIAHELAHLRRLDLWVNLLQRVVETLFFYHPAVWWVSRQLREEREMCCDELAVRATGARLAYVEALELIARERLAGVRPALAAGIRGESNMKLLARVRNVLRGAGDETGSLWPAGLLALLLPLAMWGMTWGIFNPTPAAAVADEKREGDEVEKKDGEDGDRPRKEGREREREGDAREGERKEVRRDGETPRKEGERRDGDEPKKGPRDGEVRKEGPRDGDQPRKEGERRDGDEPKKKALREGDAPKKGPREGDEFRKDPVKKEVRKDQPKGETPRKKIVREGDAPRTEAGDAESELKALVKELRAENEKLRAELRELRGDKTARPESGKQTLRDKEGEERDELIQNFGKARDPNSIAEKRDEERAAIEKKLQAVAERKDLAAREAAEAKERAVLKEREAAERKERDIERRRDQERDRADKEEVKR
ncbi:MAG TPA: M56 family metallopeptidase, partial [Pirellulaceae bacterium]|nr:M56 family metallopeptidase [Pirellulaceae bacterium]